nr:cell division cycle 5-like protein [Cryptomonas curvata]
MILSERIFFFKYSNRNWTETEDQFLKLFINKYGWNQWKKISSLFFRKTPTFCMKRWWSWVNPDVKKSKWNIMEDKKLNLIHMNIIFRFNMIFFILNRNSPQCLFRFRFIQIARKIFNNQKSKMKKLFFGLNSFAFNSCSNQVIVFYEKTLNYNNIDYLKTKLRYINKNNKKDFKNKYTFTAKKIFQFSNVNCKFYYSKFPKIYDSFVKFIKMNYIFKIFQANLIDFKKNDIIKNVFILFLKQNGSFLNLFIQNYEFFLFKKKKKIQTAQIQVRIWGRILSKLCLQIMEKIKLIFFFYYWNFFFNDYIVFLLKNYKTIFFELNYYQFDFHYKIIVFNFLKTFSLERLHKVILIKLN